MRVEWSRGDGRSSVLDVPPGVRVTSTDQEGGERATVEVESEHEGVVSVLWPNGRYVHVDVLTGEVSTSGTSTGSRRS